MTARPPVPILRREVELPLRAHQRGPFYLGLASLALSFLILLDAALCSHPPARLAARDPAASHERARPAHALRARAAARLTRPPCRARRHPAALDPTRAEFRRQAAQQLARPWAASVEPKVVNGTLHAPLEPFR